MKDEVIDELRQASVLPLQPEQNGRRRLAVATREGILVNLHLGEAEQLWIYEPDEKGKYKLTEKRATPARGGGDKRWIDLADLLTDCKAIITSGAGATPTEALGARGIDVMLVEGLIDEVLGELAQGRLPRAPVRAWQCGQGCSGTGLGCA